MTSPPNRSMRAVQTMLNVYNGKVEHLAFIEADMRPFPKRRRFRWSEHKVVVCGKGHVRFALLNARLQFVAQFKVGGQWLKFDKKRNLWKNQTYVVLKFVVKREPESVVFTA